MRESIAEIAEREARAAEADTSEEPEPEPTPEPTPEPEPEPEPQALASIGDAEIRKAEQARAQYKKRLGAILGEDAVAHECLLCAGLGHLPDLPPAGTTFAIVLTDDGPALLADEPFSGPDFKQAPDKETCDWCDGLGQTLTGAKSEHGRLAPCGRCNGNGWIQKTVELSPVGNGATNAPVSFPPAAAQSNEPGPDAWGRPFGHQHYGVPPAMIAG